MNQDLQNYLVKKYFPRLIEKTVHCIANQVYPDMTLSVLTNRHIATMSDGKYEDTASRELLYYCWEQQHAVSWDHVELCYRNLYESASLACALLLLKGESCVDKAIELIDLGLLNGARGPCWQLLTEAATELHALTRNAVDFDVPLKYTYPKQFLLPTRPEHLVPIEVETNMSLLHFQEVYFSKQVPVLLKDSISSWSAIQHWKSLNYLSSVAGRRHAPVEIGSNYLSEGAGTKIMSIDDFIANHIVQRSENIGYLAQHCLFDQIPDLRADFSIPDYCSVLNDEDSDDVIVNAWFGPVGCASPLHHDPYHNLLAQIVGYKFVRLFSPDQSCYLSPLTGKMSNNSSLDLQDDTSALNAKYTDILLHPGDVLYIPRWYWHYIASVDNGDIGNFCVYNLPRFEQDQYIKKQCIRSKQDGDNSVMIRENGSFVFSISFWWGERIEKPPS